MTLRAALLTREYPPDVYGGAGVHIEHLAAALRDQVDVRVHCFGAPRAAEEVAGAYEPWEALEGAARELAALRTFSVDLAMAAAVGDAQLVHSHTWYANLGGHLASMLWGIPHVVTTHSLEPLRPWKAEQLGGGYALSTWAERTALTHADAVIAVSEGMRDDVLSSYPDVDPARVRIIHNGVDPQAYRPMPAEPALERYGIDPDAPTAIFVGRITRQKGVTHLLDAARGLPPGSQLVLCAGSPDTDEIAAEFRARVEELRDSPVTVVWIEEMVPRELLVGLLTHARVFVCPSIYEPFGIVNLEAMACGTAVVASRVGGIPEIVVPGETGELVSFDASDDAYGTPADPEAFARDLAMTVGPYLFDETLAANHGAAGRARVEERFSWRAVAERTASLYRELVG